MWLTQSNRRLVSVLCVLQLIGSICPAFAMEQVAEYPVVVVGAGLAGLSASYRLHKDYGIKAEVFEASHRAGGRVFTESYSDLGIRVELGASFIDKDHHFIKNLAAELGLALTHLKDEGAAGRTYFFNGHVIDYAKLFQDSLPVLRQIQSDIDQIAREKGELLQGSSAKEAELDALTIEQYLTSLNASPLFKSLANATQFNENGANINKLNALALLELIKIDLTNQSFLMDGQLGDEGSKIKGGNSRLVEALLKNIPSEVNYHHRLTKIVRLGESGPYELIFQVGTDARKIRAKKVILALPMPILKSDIAMEPHELIPESLHEVINEVDYGNVTKFIMVFSRPVWRKDPEQMVEILSEKFDIWDSSFHEDGNTNYHLTVYTGGAEAMRNRDLCADQSAQEVLELLTPLFPDIESAYIGNAPSMHWPSFPLSFGSYVGAVRPGQWTKLGDLDHPAAGNIVFAGEQWSTEYPGYMNGAVETGGRAAQYIADLIKGGTSAPQ